MKIDSVITLETGVNCLLLEKVNYNNENYFLSVILDDNSEPTEDSVVLKELIEGNDTYIVPVLEEDILAELIKLFTNVFVKNAQALEEEI